MRMLPLCLALLASACSHPLQIIGKGDIISASGERDCTWAVYSSHTDPDSEACPNYVARDYRETYTAVPALGWDFAGWNNCQLDNIYCVFDIPAAIVDAHWGDAAPPLIAHFEPHYAFETLGYRVVDAAYLRASDILLLLGEDSRLYVYDVAGHETQFVQLDQPGTALSVGANGLHAVVGHSGALSYIDLQTREVVARYDVSANVFDIELAPNGHVYVMPLEDQWTRIRTVNLWSGMETLHSGASVYDSTRMALHPSGEYIYGANNGLSPSDFEKYDIRGGNAVFVDDSPYHGDYPICGDLWIPGDGQRIFTACGQVFRSSEDPATDMTHVGQIGSQRMRHMSFSGDEILALEWLADSVRVFGEAPYPLNAKRYLPKLTVDGEEFQVRGRFVFHTSSGSHLVVGQVEEGSGLALDYGIAYPFEESNGVNVRPTALAAAAGFVDMGEIVALDGSPSLDPEKSSLTYHWSLLEAPAGSAAYIVSAGDAQTTITPDLEGTYVISLVVHDGALPSHATEITIVAENPADRQTIPLSFFVQDAEYSTALDRLVMITPAPFRLVQYDLAAGLFHTTALPSQTGHVSVAPDGLTAAVGHPGTDQISLVDLVTGSILRTYQVSVPFGDLVLSGNGHIYFFPPAGNNSDYLRWINLQTGVEMRSNDRYKGGTLGDLHPSDRYIYATYADVELYDITAGTFDFLRDSPYHGDFDMCGNVWISPDGLRLYTPCGNLFKGLPDAPGDMNFNGSMAVADDVASLSHGPDHIAVVYDEPWVYDPDQRAYLDLFDSDNLAFIRRIVLPEYEMNGTPYAARGRFVFHSASGHTLVTIIEADEDAEIVFDHSLYIRH